MQQQEHILLGNSAAAALYQRYAPAILAYLIRQTSSREDAEDLLLEVFLAALEHASFTAMLEQEQQAWLWRVSQHKVADHFRRFTRRPSVPLKHIIETLYESEESSPEQVALKHEEYALLQVRLQELPQLQQEVLQLRFGYGLRCADMARVLGKSQGAVRMLLSRTLKLLHHIYTQQ